ncbi:hypothetical protein Scep_001347 [Stephania cephalantha]|uniref:Uncharacterized protein n=1 Tax=Stephania cephalantha TaxID=152367 RepID=A0AAP0L878_9MAGN
MSEQQFAVNHFTPRVAGPAMNAQQPVDRLRRTSRGSRNLYYPYYSKYENYHYHSYASPQPDFFGLIPSPQIPQHEERSIQDMMHDLIFIELPFQQSHQQCHEENQQLQQNTSLQDMMKKLLDDQQRFHEELQQFSREFPNLQNLETQFIQVNVTLQNMLDEKELCNTQPISYSEENVNVDTLKNVEVNEVTQMKIEVISERPEEPQTASKEDQHLVFVKPPTLPYIIVKPYKGVEVRERSQIFYTTNTFVLDDHDVTDSFVLEVSNELPILKEGVHAALPKAIDAPFVVDISKGEGIT